jgi:hypothetical protein
MTEYTTDLRGSSMVIKKSISLYPDDLERVELCRQLIPHEAEPAFSHLIRAALFEATRNLMEAKPGGPV